MPLILYLTASTLYLLFLAVAFFAVKEPKAHDITYLNHFAILVPAHNEELLISRLCESLLKIQYPSDHYEIFIIVDNCSDQTAEIAKTFPVQALIRNDSLQIGKGYAINWALDQIVFEKYDAVFMVDADNIVDPMILIELNRSINRGEKAIQCYNTVGNRSDSWFSQLLFVSRTINNLLYHHAKYKLGLSSYLTGNGMCFSVALLRTRGWHAFSVGEDWEYYSDLIEEGVKISFARYAKVFHQESRSLKQATSQRLRWSSGRFNVLRRFGVNLFVKGLRNRDWFTLDASLPLIFPNYSLQANLTVLAFIVCLIPPSSAFKTAIIGLSLGILFLQFMLFASGVYLAGDHWKVFKAMLYIPLFLIWKSIIDFLSFTRIYRANRWIRTERHIPYREKGKEKRY